MNMADQIAPVTSASAAQSVSSAAITEPVTSSSDYSPVVGDVVEFEWNGKHRKAIVYAGSRPRELTAIGDDAWFHRQSNFMVDSLVKVGEASGFNDEMDCDQARAIAKAYFAQPRFKVGDKVKVVREVKDHEWVCWTPEMSDLVGKIVTVSGIIKDACKIKELYDWTFPIDCLELATAPTFTGTYDEQQEQWIKYHGLKVGSKVRIVREADANENGWDNTWPGTSVGTEMTITDNRGDKGLFTDRYCAYPYFALEPA